jgi:BlaI family transcriptional regulator, penicillinase repressor
MTEIRELSKAEEEIMQAIWDIGPCYVKDIVEIFPEPKPAYNTVSTIVRILETKGFLDHNAYGRTHEYFAVISKAAYRAFATNKLMEGYFENSVEEMLSFFVKEKQINTQELDDILKIIQKMDKK